MTVIRVISKLAYLLLGWVGLSAILAGCAPTVGDVQQLLIINRGAEDFEDLTVLFPEEEGLTGGPLRK